MKNIIVVLFFLGIYVVPIVAYSDTAFLEAGVFKRFKSETTSAPYERGAKVYSASLEFDDGVDDEIFPIVQVGTYSHNNNPTYFGAVGYAFRTPGLGPYLQFNARIGYLDKTSVRHATNEQFFIGAATGYKAKNYNIRLGWEHISNGSRIFGSPTPNYGENFFTLGVGVPF